MVNPEEEWGPTCSSARDCPALRDVFRSPALPLASWLLVPCPQSLSADEFTIYYRFKTASETMSKFCLQASSYFCNCIHPFLLFCRWNCCLISYLETITPPPIMPFSQCLQIVCIYDLFYNNLIISKCSYLKRASLIPPASVPLSVFSWQIFSKKFALSAPSKYPSICCN